MPRIFPFPYSLAIASPELQMKRTLVIALILALQTGAALAHTALESATPAKDATVTAPEALTLTFSEAVTLAFTGITLTAADGTAVTTGEATLNADTGSVLTVPLTAPLLPGSYTVEWHALSEDGHKVKGTYGFTVN